MLIAGKIVLILFLLLSLILSLFGLTGAAVAFLSTLVFAFFNGFELFTPRILLLLLVLALMAEGVELLAGTIGAKTFKASRQAVVGSLIGLVIGILLGVPTLQLYLIPLGLVLGVVFGELAAGRTEFPVIMRSLLGVLIGKVGGILVKFCITVTMGVIILIRLF